MRTVTAFVASLFLLAGFSVAQDVVPDDQVNPDVAAQVDVWIEQMESSKFTVRRNAARQLERIGAAAIEPLEKLVRDGSLDASEGALEILQKHLSGGIIQLAEKARESIQRIADNKDHPRSNAAQRMLTPVKPQETTRPRLPVPAPKQIARRTQIRVSSVNGKRNISVDLDGQKYRFRDTENGIRVERPDGKGGMKIKEYKDAEEMKKADSEAHQIYKRYGNGFGGGGIQLRFNGRAFPAVPQMQQPFGGNPFGNPVPQIQPRLRPPNVPQFQPPKLQPLPPKLVPQPKAPAEGNDIIEV